MAAISTSGLISGIDTDSIITKLLALDGAPVTVLQARITSDQTLGEAYSALGSQLSALQTTAQSLERPRTFGDTTATTSDPSVLTANTSTGASVGTYSLRIARTVTTQQLVSAGFTDSTSAKVGAGTITIEEGSGADLATQTPLGDLDGGAGVARGQFRITDRSGASAVIDTSSAVSVDDVVADINAASTVSVRASISGNHLVLTDTSGKTTSNLIVQDLGTGTSAASLGIAASVASATVTGTDVYDLSRSTLLASLNDGRGVTLGTGGATGDFTVHLRNGSTFNVNLAGVTTVGGAIDAINAAAGTNATASLSTGGSGLTLTDKTVGLGTLSVTANNGSRAAANLGLTAAAAGATITGAPVIASIDSTLLSSLNGGAGITLGSLSIVDATGGTHTVNLASATDVQGVIAAINAGTAGKVTASLKASGNGIQLTDVGGGTGSLTVAAGPAATALGLAGSTTTGTIAGASLNKQWLTNNTLLSTLNGGKGIGAGSFTVTTSAGASATVAVDASTKTVGQLLYQLNNNGVPGLTASVNATGNGISLADTSNGAGTLTVAADAGTTASDLNLQGSAATTGNATINGAYVKTIAVGANDTLATVQAAINAAGAGVTATVISDGSATAPYRLSLTAANSGTAGAVVFDAGTTGLSTQTLVAAQDAAVFVGGNGSPGPGGAAQPLLVTSGTDTVTSVIPGVSLNLLGTSTGTVQLTVAADADNLVASLGSFATTFNTLTTTIGGLSTFNTSNNTAGLLLGDPVALNITSNLFTMLGTTVPNNGAYPNLYSVGFGVGANNQLTFDADTFRAALAADPTAVQNLFNATSTATAPGGATTTTKTGVAYAMDATLTKLVDPVSGTVTAAESELTTEERGFTGQITQLNALLDQKKAVYEQQFADMESALATLQSQAAALGSIGGAKTTASSASSTTSSSSSSASS